MEVPPPTRSLPASGPLLVLFLLPPVATQLIPLLLGEVTSQAPGLSSLSTWHHLTHRQPPTNVGLQAPAPSGDPSVSAPAQGGLASWALEPRLARRVSRRAARRLLQGAHEGDARSVTTERYFYTITYFAES